MGTPIQIAGHEESHTPYSDLDGFNEGWIEFENGEASSRKEEVALTTVLQMLIERERKRPHVECECLAGAVAGLMRL